MEERLTTEIDVPDGLLSAEFPPMMIQTLVENSIKHGLEPKAEGGHLAVKAEIRHGKLCVTVADTGLGFESRRRQTRRHRRRPGQHPRAAVAALRQQGHAHDRQQPGRRHASSRSPCRTRPTPAADGERMTASSRPPERSRQAFRRGSGPADRLGRREHAGPPRADTGARARAALRACPCSTRCACCAASSRSAAAGDRLVAACGGARARRRCWSRRRTSPTTSSINGRDGRLGAARRRRHWLRRATFVPLLVPLLLLLVSRRSCGCWRSRLPLAARRLGLAVGALAVALSPG